MVSILALAEAYGFLWVAHNVSIDIFEGVDEHLGPLMSVCSMGELGSLGCIRHGCHANAVLLLTQAAQQVRHTIQRGGHKRGTAILCQLFPRGRGFP